MVCSFSGYNVTNVGIESIGSVAVCLEVSKEYASLWGGNADELWLEIELDSAGEPTAAFRREIDEKYTFPSSYSFRTEEEEWMSKLTLDFYLSYLSFGSDDPNVYANIDSRKLLYDEIDPADIEGGGRILIALQDDTFTVPDDADSGLIYIGLDSDFNPVTDMICR